MIERSPSTCPASTPDPVTAWMAVAGSGVIPRKATSAARIRLAHRGSRCRPTNRTRVASPLSEKTLLPAHDEQKTVDRRDLLPLVHCDHDPAARQAPARRAVTAEPMRIAPDRGFLLVSDQNRIAEVHLSRTSGSFAMTSSG